ARLALLEGQALVDLGRAADGLRRIDAALSAAPRLVAAEYERGVALFELCRFAEARRMFEKVLVATPDHGHALYHLGLIDERDGKEESAAHTQAGRAGQAVGRGKAGSKAKRGRDGGEDVQADGGGAAPASEEGVRCGMPDRAIVLYRRNLLRTVSDVAELDRAI